MSYTLSAMEFMQERCQIRRWEQAFLALLFIGFLVTNSIQLDMSSHLLYGASAGCFGLIFLLGSLRKTPWKWADSFLCLFLLAYGVSFFVKQQPYGFQEMTTFFVGGILYFLARFLNIPRWPFAEIFACFGTVIATHGIATFLLGPGDRLSGIFHGVEPYAAYPNAMALFLLMVLPCTIFVFIKKTGSRILPGLALFIIFTAFILTFSRGSLLALLATAFLMFFLFLWQFSFKNIWRTAFVLVCIFLISVVFAGVINSLKPIQLDPLARIGLEDISGVQSVNERFEFWKGALEMIQEYPLFGVGPGGFSSAYPRYQDYWLVLSGHPHNIFLKLMSENGLLSGILFALFLFILALAAGKDFLSQKWAPRQWVLGAMILGVVLHHMVDYNLNFTLLSAMFFLSLGAFLRDEDQRNAKEQNKMFLFRVTIFILSVGISVLSVFQGLGMLKMYAADELWRKEKNPEAALALLERKVSLPFDMNRIDIQAGLYVELEKDQDLEVFLEPYLQKYPLWDRPVYFAGYLDSQKWERALELNPYNSMEYYYLWYATRVTKAEDVQAIAELVELYVGLLRLNMHNTVLSQNPGFAEKLALLYPAELEPQLKELRKAWKNETIKFDVRFGTTLYNEFIRRQ